MKDDFLLELIDLIKTGEWRSEHGDEVTPGFALSMDLEALAAKIREAALSGARTAGELAVGCHRSHPHENMDAGCQRLTEIARENNAAANMGTEARCWHCGMVTLKAHYDDCPASGARTATDTGGKPDA